MRPAVPSSLTLALAVLLLGTLSTPAAAQYKWKDANGQVHISDLPPPRDIPDNQVLQRPANAPRVVVQLARPSSTAATAPASAASPATRNPVDPELEARRKRADDEARGRARADEDRLAAQRADNCQRAQAQLALLDSGRRLQRLNERGERMPVDEAARAEDVQAARQAVASDCR